MKVFVNTKDRIAASLILQHFLDQNDVWEVILRFKIFYDFPTICIIHEFSTRFDVKSMGKYTRSRRVYTLDFSIALEMAECRQDEK